MLCYSKILLESSVHIFQGGGQPSDVGAITSISGDSVFEVTKVVNDKENPDVFLHFGSFTGGSSAFKENDKVC